MQIDGGAVDYSFSEWMNISCLTSNNLSNNNSYIEHEWMDHHSPIVELKTKSVHTETDIIQDRAVLDSTTQTEINGVSSSDFGTQVEISAEFKQAASTQTMPEIESTKCSTTNLTLKRIENVSKENKQSNDCNYRKNIIKNHKLMEKHILEALKKNKAVTVDSIAFEIGIDKQNRDYLRLQLLFTTIKEAFLIVETNISRVANNILGTLVG